MKHIIEIKNNWDHLKTLVILYYFRRISRKKNCTQTDYKRDGYWFDSQWGQINHFHFFFLVIKSATLVPSLNTQYLENWAKKWGMMCLSTRYPPPTLLCPRYSDKNNKHFLHVSIRMQAVFFEIQLKSRYVYIKIENEILQIGSRESE